MISIGIPFYNAEAYLADAIRSIFAQTYQDWELLLVDDGSTDGSLEIARSVNDTRVRVLSDGNNRRLSYRLNQITSEAKYDLVGRMDADDLISPSRFEKQLAVLAANPEIDLVTTGVCSITNDNRPVGVRCSSPHDQITGRKLLLGQCMIVHAAMLGRKSWFLRNPYDPNVSRAGDYELWLRAFSNDDFRCYRLSDYLYYYREEINVTPEKMLAAYEIQRTMYKKYGYLGFTSLDAPVMSAKLHGKAFIVRLLSFIGSLDYLLARRNTAIVDQDLMSSFDQEIREIYQTKVPGLDA